MKSTATNLEATKVKLTVEVPAAELEKPMQAAYREISQQVAIPGFRKGKVPARIIDRRIGRGYVIQTAVDKSLSDFYRQALTEHDIRPLAAPEVSIEKLPAETGAFEGELVFTAEVACVPEFELPALSDLEIQVSPVEVKDSDVDAELDNLRKRFGSLKTVERPVQEGDFVSIDLTATIEDEEIDSMAGVSYEVGSKTMLEGLDEALEGLSVDEDTSFESKLGGGEHAGEDAIIKVTVRSVKERELPKLDEDFVQMASEFDTVAELKEDLHKQVRDSKRAEQAVEARDRLVEELLKKVELPLPAEVIDQAIEGLESDEKEARAGAEEQLRREILLDRLVEQTEVEVKQQDIIQFVIQASQAYGVDPQRLMSDQQQMAAIYAELARTKAVAIALDDVTVKDADGNEVDMSEFTKDARGEAEQGDGEKKPAAKKTSARKTAVKKPTAKKPTAKKADAKKADAKTESAAKVNKEETPAKKPAAKKAPAKKPATKSAASTAAKKASAEDAAETKPATKKAPAKKAPAKKAPAKKPAAKKTADKAE